MLACSPLSTHNVYHMLLLSAHAKLVLSTCCQAKPYPRADYSHSATQLMKIGHDNQLLVERLTEISHQPPGWVRDLNKTEPCNTASSAVNRRKAATTIAQVRG